jgi:hypothetical protein
LRIHVTTTDKSIFQLLLVLLLCVSINYSIYTYIADILPEWHHILRFFCYNTPKIIPNQNSKLKFLRNTLKRKVSCSNYLLNIAIQRSLKYTMNHPPLHTPLPLSCSPFPALVLSKA